MIEKKSGEFIGNIELKRRTRVKLSFRSTAEAAGIKRRTAGSPCGAFVRYEATAGDGRAVPHGNAFCQTPLFLALSAASAG